MSAVLINAAGWTLLHFVWQGALIGLCTALLLAVLRTARPQLRYGVACAGLLACLLWPVVELIVRLQGDAMLAPHMRLADRLLTDGGGGNAHGLIAWLQQQLMWIVSVWAVCACALALRMGLGLMWVRRAARADSADPRWQARLTSMAARFGVKRPVRLRIVRDLDSPLTAGWWRPIVLVPASLMSSMPPDLLEALLAHEIAHIKRCDYLVNLGQHVVEILLLYHPAVWWISSRIRFEREQIADAMAADHLGEPRTLARALSELEQHQFAGHHLAQAANGADLLPRIKRLLQPGREATNWRAALPVLGLVVACVSLYAHAASTGVPMTSAALDSPARADFSSCAKPRYPDGALAAGYTGTVTLDITVAPDGHAVAGVVKRSSGHPSLDQAARDGIMQCTFKSAMVGGRPVQASMLMQYVWTLN